MIDGKSFSLLRENYSDMMNYLCVRGAVFARMSPEQKQLLVEHLQELGYYVGKYYFLCPKISAVFLLRRLA